MYPNQQGRAQTLWQGAGGAFGTSLGWYTVHPGGFLLTVVAGAVFPCYSYPGQGVLCDQHRLQDEGAGVRRGRSSGAWSRLGTSREAPGLEPVGASVLPRPLRSRCKG